MENRYSLLFTIIQRGYVETAMEAAREAGARGGTVLAARGTGNFYIETFLGAAIEPEKEILIILTPKDTRSEIMKAIYKAVGLDKEGQGLLFALPVEDVIGSFNLKKFEEENN
ncbi:MAG: P-II family nitrogen regulator [Christensenellales bacterium]|jgi:nitrogen regulatory protein PII|nr:P-II family nitrogen regulator [Clostridiales bacterium]